MTPVLVFDIETIPDIAGLRTLHELPATLAEAEVAELLVNSDVQPMGGVLVPMFQAMLLNSQFVKPAWTGPAPSPVSESQPHAPRCVRLRRIWMPLTMMSWDFLPLMLTINPTPQLSCSNSGRYSPSGARRIDSHPGLSPERRRRAGGR